LTVQPGRGCAGSRVSLPAAASAVQQGVGADSEAQAMRLEVQK